MQRHYASEYLSKLERLSIRYYLEKQLKKKYQSTDDRTLERFQKNTTDYENRIAYFAETILQNNYKPEDLAIPTTQNSDFEKIATKAAVYFQQGREMLQTALYIPENSSPLVEYYGFLQCAKGMIQLELDDPKKLLFSRHGLSFTEKNTRYISAIIQKRGVFSALLIRRGEITFKKFEEAIDMFFSQPYCPSLEEIITDKHTFGDPVLAFIGS